MTSGDSIGFQVAEKSTLLRRWAVVQPLQMLQMKEPLMREHVSPDRIRASFSAALSEMYRNEVPLYAELLDIVRSVNAASLSRNANLNGGCGLDELSPNFDCEPHGAIRVGTPGELAALRRVFAVLGMFPVGYYDLSPAGVPVHSTAFRPTDQISLSVSPLRIFCSLLRLELIDDPELRQRAANLLASRQILSNRAMELVALAEAEGGLTVDEAREFVGEILDTFRWQETARVSEDIYRKLLGVHRLVADVVAFRGPHINHLTPRTLDIDAVQRTMVQQGIKAKAFVEGPPPRNVPILLRQTSCQALSEPILFQDENGAHTVAGSHTARFGEVEQRGLALTPKGRELYDALLASAQRPLREQPMGYEARLTEAFAGFPDDLDTVRKEGLGYFEFRLTPKGIRARQAGQIAPGELEDFITQGYVEPVPMVYEDFLPVSAAGIFQSNLGGAERGAYSAVSSQSAFEAALGIPVLDPFVLYRQREVASMADALQQLQQVGA